jgi:uncharacterized protein (TIGR01777 family)
VPRFVQRSAVRAPATTVFDWHARPGAFERLVPPWQHVRILERQGSFADARVVFIVGAGPLRARWTAQHGGCVPGREFRDVQVQGPFARWEHTHRFLPDGEASSVLEDDIEWALPAAPLGPLLGDRAVERLLARTFRFRHERTRADLARHAAVAERGAQRFVVSGASGLVGGQLVAFLESGGHRVQQLVRRPPRPGSDEVRWDPAAGEIDASALEGADVAVHLAGESIAAGRWTPARKAAIRESRVAGTRLLATTLARLRRPPRVLLSASAIGFYGTRDQPVAEDDAPGAGFLADVCRAWEAATGAASDAGIRVVLFRLGVVLSAGGGALAKMLPPFRFGLGGVVGSGRQPLSWIALDDVVGAIHHLAFADEVVGPVNLVAPDSVTNAELTHTLGHVLHRPTLAPLPAVAVRLLFGEMGEALLLEGAHVEPARLAQTGFRFLHPELEGALRTELGAFE